MANDSRKRAVTVATVLLLIFILPVCAYATNVTLSLSTDSAVPGQKVTASGQADPDTWVSIKVLDSTQNIIVLELAASDSTGNYSYDFLVPGNVAGTCIVVAGYGSNVANKNLTVNSSPSSPDTTAPNWSGASLSAGSITKNSLTLTWTAATDDVRVTGYRILKNTVPLEDVPGSTLSYTVTGLTSGTTYSFKVEAGDAAGNWSTNGPTTTATTEYAGSGGSSGSGGGTASGGGSVGVGSTIDTPAPGQAAGLTDITGHWAMANINRLVTLGAINGYPGGSFMPDQTITRAEFATVLVKAFKLSPQDGKVFADTSGHWAKDYIATAAANGIVSGYGADIFGPDDLITREQMAVMIVKAAKLAPSAGEVQFADRASISGWAREALAAATVNGIIKGYPDNTVQPKGNATRAEAVTVIVNALG